MATAEVQSGLEGVVAFATEIAEPDKEGGALRYRGVDIDDLVGKVLVREGLGPARGRLVRARDAARRAVPDSHAHRRHARGCAGRSGSARAVVGLPAAARHRRPDRARPARARVGDGSVLRRPVRAWQRQDARAGGGHRPGQVDPRALPDALARRGRPRSREGDRRLLDLGRRARDERLDLHRARDCVHRRRRGRRAVRRGGRVVRSAARRRALARAPHARRGGGDRRRGEVRQGRARPRRAPDGLRPPRVPRRGPARPRAAPDGARDRRAARSRLPRRWRTRRWRS